MQLPFDKQFILSTETAYLSDYTQQTILCLPHHLGSFGKMRKNHIHEGIDIYCNSQDSVYAMCSGVIVGIYAFTGGIAGSPWWEDTYCICIQSDQFTLNYGELIPLSHLKVGDVIQEGQEIGKITTVLKKDKGLPMNMLHLEMYTSETIQPIKEWTLNTPQPSHLLDPTSCLLSLISH